MMLDPRWRNSSYEGSAANVRDRKGGRAAICHCIVLVCTELSASLRLVLQALLLRGIGVADLKEKLFLPNGLSVILLDDLITLFSSSKTV